MDYLQKEDIGFEVIVNNKHKIVRYQNLQNQDTIKHGVNISYQDIKLMKPISLIPEHSFKALFNYSFTSIRNQPSFIDEDDDNYYDPDDIIGFPWTDNCPDDEPNIDPTEINDYPYIRLPTIDDLINEYSSFRKPNFTPTLEIKYSDLLRKE